MDEVFYAAKFAVTGVLVGTAVATATDYVGGAVLSMVQIPPASNNDRLGKTGRAAFVTVTSATLAAAGILAGDKVMNMLVSTSDDPLFRLFYLNTAFQSSRLVGSAVTNGRSLWQSLLMALLGELPRVNPNPLPPPSGGGQPAADAPKCGGCASK